MPASSLPRNRLDPNAAPAKGQPGDGDCRQDAQHHKVAEQPEIQQITRFGQVGLCGVLQHVVIDDDSVAVHEMGGQRRKQQDDYQHGFGRAAEAGQRQQQQGAPDKHGGEGGQCQRVAGGQRIRRQNLAEKAQVAAGNQEHSHQRYKGIARQPVCRQAEPHKCACHGPIRPVAAFIPPTPVPTPPAH